MPRSLYLAAYDVCDPARLRRVHKVVKQFATGGQKSVFECYLHAGERRELLRGVQELVAPQQDRFALLRVEERTKPVLRGIALPASDPSFYYVG